MAKYQSQISIGSCINLYSFYLVSTRNSQVCLPLVILEERGVIRTEVFWGTSGRDGGVEPATKGDTVDIASMDTKSDDAPSELVHNHECPVTIQKNGFTPKQINAPQAVFAVPEEGQPRRSSITRTWPVMHGEDAPHHIFINIGSKCFIGLLCELTSDEKGVYIFYTPAPLGASPYRLSTGTSMSGTRSEPAVPRHCVHVS